MTSEVSLLQEIEKHIRQHKDSLLMEIVPNDCGCSHKTKKVFRNTGAFEISIILDKLDKLRKAL